MPGFGTPFAMLEYRDATPYATEVYRNSLMPHMDPFTPEYVDPGRAKFLEIQKMEWEYQPPSATKLPFKGDFDWFKPTTLVEPIVVRPVADNFNIKPFEPITLHGSTIVEPPVDKYNLKHFEPIKLHGSGSIVAEPVDTYNIKPFEPIKLVTEDLRNPFFGEKHGTDFGIQPIKIGKDVLSSGGMHDSFNVTRSGDIFNGHTTIELKGGLKTRLFW